MSHHIPRLKITYPCKILVSSDIILVSSDIRPSKTFYNVLGGKDYLFCNRACLNFQAFALHTYKMTVLLGICVK